jgi:hypothetical protein
VIGDSDLESKSDDGVMSASAVQFLHTTQLFLANASPPMAPTPLDTLKKGFNQLSETINDKRRTLVAKLAISVISKYIDDLNKTILLHVK